MPVKDQQKEPSVKKREPAPWEPEALQAVAKDAWARNQPEANKAAPEKRQFLVRYKELEHRCMAVDEKEAWAIACDKWQRYPSPKSAGKSVEPL